MGNDNLTRREFLRSAGAMTAAWLGPGTARLFGARPDRPNIVLIMADDLGYETLGCNGGTSYATPHLDRLAAGGMRFEHAYCAPLCSPTRVLLMTGRYGFRNYREWGVLDPKEQTFGHVLRKAGYATCVSGKWQLCKFDDPANADHPRRSGFDEHCVWTWHYRKKKPSRYWDPFIWQNGKMLAGTEGKFGPDIQCDFVIDFIRRNKHRPFFAYYPMNLVHAPFIEPPDMPGKKRVGGKGQANYAAMVAYMDRCVGRVIAELDKLGLRKKTLVLFTGDNGTPKGIRSKMGDVTIPGGKGSMTDGGTHVPLIANCPGTVPAGKTTDALVDFSDFLPTLVELARTEPPAGVPIDGRSFLPVLLGKKKSVREWAYIHHGDAAAGPKLRAVRTQRWKLYADGRLFDIASDPFEKKPVEENGRSSEAKKAREQLTLALKSITGRP